MWPIAPIGSFSIVEKLADRSAGTLTARVGVRDAGGELRRLA
jgi:hypothetical protein